MATPVKYPTVLVTYIYQNSRTEHLIFTYQRSVYVITRERLSDVIHTKTKHTFETEQEAKAFEYGFIFAETRFGTPTASKLQTVSLLGYEVKHY